jgi:hypothetical protein
MKSADATRATRASAARCTEFMCVAVALAGWLAACSGDPGWSGQVPAADAALFQSMAYPALMRDCAFSECHGSEHRFFQIFGPGRTRLLETTKSDEPVTDAELQVSYQRTVSMLATESGGNVTSSLLLRKPLEATAGGVGHRGVDDYGRNVYASVQAAGYQALLHWVHGTAVAKGPGTPMLGGAGSAP